MMNVAIDSMKNIDAKFNGIYVFYTVKQNMLSHQHNRI